MVFSLSKQSMCYNRVYFLITYDPQFPSCLCVYACEIDTFAMHKYNYFPWHRKWIHMKAFTAVFPNKTAVGNEKLHPKC